MKKTVSICAMLIALCVSATVLAYDFKNGNVYYKIIDGKSVEVTYNDVSDQQRYTGSISIPSEVTYQGNKYNVIGIGDSAFWKCGQLTKVNFSASGIKYIGERAFLWCDNLESISLNDSLQRIDEAAFCFCKKLEYVNFAHHTSGLLLCYNAFYGCENLKELDFFGGYPGEVYPLTLGTMAFGDCHSLTSIDLRNIQNTALPENLLTGCENLKSVILDERTTEIKSRVFWGCTNLTEIKNIENITKIGYGAFMDCSSLEYLSVLKCVSDIAASTFQGCTNLKGFVWKSYTKIGHEAFKGCKNLSSITFPEELKEIEYNAFQDCPLDTVICKNETPATMQPYDTFDETTEQSAILIVPCGTTSKYSTKAGWKNFAHIEEDCSGIEDLEVSDVLSVYPNPAENYITVEAEDVVTVINNAGQTVKEINNVKGSVTIDITDMKSGVYYVKSGNKTEKLIIK